MKKERKNPIFVGFLIIAFVLTILKCRGKSGEKNEGIIQIQDNIRLDEFCEKYIRAIEAINDKTIKCGLTYERISYTECPPYISELINLAKEGKVKFEQQIAKQYIEEIVKILSLDCSEFINRRRTNLIRINKLLYYLVSKDVFSGNGNEGAQCIFDQECAKGFFCSDSCPSKCTRMKQEGEECSDIAPCKEGLTCISQRCVRTGEEGTPCTQHIDCMGELVCLSGVCSRPDPPGQECSPELEKCETQCNPESKKCIIFKVSLVLNECGEFGDEIKLCPLDISFCKLSAPEQGRFTCSPLLKEGENCIPTYSGGRISEKIYGMYATRCEDGLWCSPEGICKKIPKENEKCEGNCASGLFCSKDGVCRKLKEVGDVCLENIECKSKKCEMGICKPEKKMAGELCSSDNECYNLNCRGGICCSQQIIQKVQSSP